MKRLGKIWWHWINDNTKPAGRKGTILRQGRLYIHFGEWATIHWSWAWFTSFCHSYIQVDSEDGIIIGNATPLLALWFSFITKPMRKFCNKWDWWELGWSIHHWTLWLNIWKDTSGSDFTQSWWKRREFNWNVVDFLFGVSKYSTRVLSTTKTIVPMPEKSYKAKVEIFESTWKRPRWPWPTRMVRSDIKMEEPIPFPGKGENSWDCGEDALHGSCAPGDNVEDAVAGVVGDVLNSRKKYGGRNWNPASA